MAGCSVHFFRIVVKPSGHGESIMGIADQLPLVTIAIPTYRRPDWLRGAIQSALARAYRNTVVLVSASNASAATAALVAGQWESALRYRRNDVPTDGWQNGLVMYRDAQGEL